MKYIIDVPDGTTCINTLKYEDSKCVAARSYIISDLTPYIEPDRKAIEDEVWEFASMLMNMHPDVAEDIYWSMNGGKGIGVAAEMSYQEAKSKFEAWMKQKDKIHVGDEIISVEDDVKAVMLDCADYESIYVITEHGCVERWKCLEGVKKTGRHFPEVVELLEKMRGES